VRFKFRADKSFSYINIFPRGTYIENNSPTRALLPGAPC